MRQNLEHYHKVLKTQVFKDKIYNKLKDNGVRDKILARNLRWDAYDSKDVYEFLYLLQRQNGQIGPEFRPI